MQVDERLNLTNCQNWLCPDINEDWQLAQLEDSDKIILRSKIDNSRRYQFNTVESYALLHFTGQWNVAQVQKICQQQLGENIDSQLVEKLWRKLVIFGILQVPNTTESIASPKLKSVVHWIPYSQDYWRLRNPEDVTYLRVTDFHKTVISQFGKLPLTEIAKKYQISLEEIEYLLGQLTVQGMLEGTKKAKPPKRRLTPLRLLYFDFPLCNPDSWLTKHIDKVRFIYTSTFGFFLLHFLTAASVISLFRSSEIFSAGVAIWNHYGAILLIPFALLMMVVVSLHELAHAFTLKHFGGIVPEIGIMFIFLIPGAYTITTDAYGLVKRRQQALVMAAGIISQLLIWAIAWLFWNITTLAPDLQKSWLNLASYLLMVAAQWTIILNLNPLNKFDGYYLAVALTGIENLRDRSFQFYANLFRQYPSQEKPSDKWILAAYAPLSIAYLVWAFSQLALWIWSLARSHLLAAAITILVLLVWELLFSAHQSKSQS